MCHGCVKDDGKYTRLQRIIRLRRSFHKINTQHMIRTRRLANRKPTQNPDFIIRGSRAPYNGPDRNFKPFLETPVYPVDMAPVPSSGVSGTVLHQTDLFPAGQGLFRNAGQFNGDTAGGTRPVDLGLGNVMDQPPQGSIPCPLNGGNTPVFHPDTIPFIRINHITTLPYRHLLTQPPPAPDRRPPRPARGSGHAGFPAARPAPVRRFPRHRG